MLFLACQTGEVQAACESLPERIQAVNVSYIDNAADMQHLDDALVEVVQTCMDISPPDKLQAACLHGRVTAEQVLRVIGRIDQAAKHNDFLKSVKLKSYKLSVGLLDRSRQMERSSACRR